MTLMVRIFLLLSLITIGAQCQQLKKKILVVSIIPDKPYIMIRDSPNSNLTGNDRFEGYIVDLIDAIAKRLDFNYVLQLNTAMYGFGYPFENDSWNGLIGDLVDRHADISAGAISITAERESIIDFTVPFMISGIGVVHKTERYERKVLDHFIHLFYPFEFYSTDLFLLLTLVFGIILLLLRRKYNTIIFRILLGLWFLFLFIFAAHYVAQLTSHFVFQNTYDTNTVPFASIEDVASQEQMAYGCIKGGATESFFRNAEFPLYKKMWSRMLTTIPSPLVSSRAEGIERVLMGGYAFITDSAAIEYMSARYCNLYQAGGLIDSKGFGLALPHGSPFRKGLNAAILSLQEEGFLLQLKRKWWHERNGGGVCEN